MTNFEIITQSPYNLQRFLETVQEDALLALGCGNNLKMPDCSPKIWEKWLSQEALENVVSTPYDIEIEGVAQR